MTDYSCPICKKPAKARHPHVIQPVNFNEGDPLAFTIDMHRCYLDPVALARVLGLARQELKEFFPGKKFDIQPARFMLRRYGEGNVVLGEAYVLTYVVFEK